MATKQLINPQVINAQFTGMTGLPILRQFGLLIGLAASIAIGVYVVLWSQDPTQRLLYGGLSEKDIGQVVEVLQGSGIRFKLDPRNGGISVPDKDLYQARLKLAEQGLPRGGTRGFEMLEKDSSFGTSQFMETARYQRAMEGELARSVMAMRSVKSARVHIAIPKQSAFIRNRQKPTASVLVELYGGRTLGPGQVAAITHLVSSSIPNLETENVSVMDQSGRLLTQQQGSGDLAAATAQLDYVRSLEQYYIERIENLLTPIVGPGGVRAQVAADVDLTLSEQTAERFTPDSGKVRSEQIVEETVGGASGGNVSASGVPGALSNQPGSDAANAAAGATPEKGALQTAAGSETTSGSRRSTRNYELDKVISHTKTTPGKILKLSVAVVVDHQRVTDEDGEVTVTPRTPEDIQNFTALVREAVGFSEARGDSVQVINTPFAQAPAIEELPEPGMLEQPIVWDIGRQGLAGMVVLFIIFFVLRPVLSGLASRPAPPSMNYPAGAMALPPGTGGNMPMVVEGQAPMVGGGMEGGGSVDVAKSAVNQDAKRAAQVVKSWVASDGG